MRPLRLTGLIVVVFAVTLFFTRSCALSSRYISPDHAKAKVPPAAPDHQSAGPSDSPAPATTHERPPVDRMRIGQFTSSGRVLKLDRMTMAEGRIKAPPVSVAFHRIEFEAFDANGTVVYRGSLDHPTKHVYEYEDPLRPGQLRSVSTEDHDGSLLLRLPGELAVDHITFSEVSGPPGAPGVARALLASLALPR